MGDFSVIKCTDVPWPSLIYSSAIIPSQDPILLSHFHPNIYNRLPVSSSKQDFRDQSSIYRVEFLFFPLPCFIHLFRYKSWNRNQRYKFKKISVTKNIIILNIFSALNFYFYMRYFNRKLIWNNIDLIKLNMRYIF